MRIVKGGEIKFDTAGLTNAIMDDLVYKLNIAAKRMEQDAKTYLNERIGDTLVPNPNTGDEGVSKSSGTLAEGIKGFVRAGKTGIEVGVMASAIELGQWEASQGEAGLAASTRGTGSFDYAAVLEGGSGIYGPKDREINKKMIFWPGDYRDNGNPRTVKTVASQGQPGNGFLAEAIVTAMPAIGRLLDNVGNNIRVSDFVRMEQ